MTPERYSQVKSLFQLVLEQPVAQRPEFLERACGADRALYSQVRELLLSDSTSQDFLEKPALTPLSKVLADAAADIHEPMPKQIGPYAIQNLLGSGGMGAVYLASRADKTYNKLVAIKVIHKGIESDRIIQRFRRERQIVASLDHPNIARLLDGGATEDGRPYIVMEYVEGIAIDTWCDQRKLNTRQRLQLFLQVCEALHYAHQNLVIHRDIKPGNILVRPDSTVKLLDFGIAKLMTPEPGSAVVDKTATSMRLMTPQYASPEQIKGEPVTTASDVYLLGIVLYELLTGHRPYQTSNDDPLDAVRGFAQGEPQPPSQAIFRTTERQLPDGRRQVTRNSLLVSQIRDGNPGVLTQNLKGELDAILLRALRRDPKHRYQSTAQFADDIRNHLNHQPVSALPDNTAYRLRLFLRRNMAATVAAAATFSLLVLIAVFAVWQAYRARTEHQRAETRFSEVRKLSNAVLFDVQDALAPLPGTTPARRLLVNKALDYLGALAKESANDTALQRDLAAGYIRVGNLQGNPNSTNLGDSAGAFNSYRSAQTLLQAAATREPKNRQIINDLATANEAVADMLTLNGDTAGAIQSLRAAVQHREAAGAPPATKISTYHKLAIALSNTTATAEAETLSRKAHQMALGLTGSEAPRQAALSHTRLAAVLRQIGNHSAAADSYRTAIKLYEQLAAATPLAATPKRDLAQALEDLAELETSTGNTAAATPLGQRSLQLRRELAVTDPQNLQIRRDLAYAFLKKGATEDAIESFRQLITLDLANILARRDLAHAWHQQGDAHAKARNTAAALSSYREFLQSARDWIQRDPANPYANQMLAIAQLKLAEVQDHSNALTSARGAISIIDALLEKEPENTLFRRDRAFAQWVLGHTLANGASQPAEWKSAEAELQRARLLFAEIINRNQLTAEDRDLPKAIANQITACRQTGGF